MMPKAMENASNGKGPASVKLIRPPNGYSAGEIASAKWRKLMAQKEIIINGNYKIYALPQICFNNIKVIRVNYLKFRKSKFRHPNFKTVYLLNIAILKA
jgi:hypothetical protein